MVRIIRWHSINLIPHLTIYSICSDRDYDVAVARGIDIMLFGYVVVITVPSKKNKRFYSSPRVGPLWSRRRKCWYRFREINKENPHA